MQEQTLNIETTDGKMETFITHPDGKGPFPVVVLYMDAPGIREELYDFARRVGTVGYYCIVPDLYYRLGRKRYDLSQVTDEMREEYLGCMRTLSNGMIVEDTRAVLHFLEGQSAARPGIKGCMGYCMSGQFVMSVAGTFPEQFRATASYHGVGHITDQPDSPHLLANKLQGEFYFGFAEEDPYVPLEQVEQLRGIMEASPAKTTIDVHPGTLHGYSFPQRPVFVKEAAERNWERTFAMFHRQIPAI